MRPSRRRLALAVAASLLPIVAVGLSATSGCRQDLCLLTFKAVCACDDPSRPELKSCTASYEVLTCDGDAGVDPCASANCCGPRGGGRPDGAIPTDGAIPIDGPAPIDDAGPTDGAARTDGPPRDAGSTD